MESTKLRRAGSLKNLFIRNAFINKISFYRDGYITTEMGGDINIYTSPHFIHNNKYNPKSVNEIFIPGIIKKRNDIDLEGKDTFIIPVDYFGEKRYHLFIHEETLCLTKFVEVERQEHYSKVSKADLYRIDFVGSYIDKHNSERFSIPYKGFAYIEMNPREEITDFGENAKSLQKDIRLNLGITLSLIEVEQLMLNYNLGAK